MLQYVFTKSAQKELRRLPRTVATKIVKEIIALCRNDHPLFDRNVKKLAGVSEVYRLRVGEYRVVFSYEKTRLLIIVIDIATRQNIGY